MCLIFVMHVGLKYRDQKINILAIHPLMMNDFPDPAAETREHVESE